MTLTEFLTARLDEDEAWAKHRDIVTFGYDDSRMNPARVLAEVEAKRGVVWFLTSQEADPMVDRPWWWDEQVADPVLMRLALPYADHPDWREEWRP